MPVEPARPGTAQPDSVQPGLVEPDGGDPVCWSHLLCSRCGAMPEPATPDDDERGWASCWRCGFRTGTGSSSGAAFLRLALELTFFPELYAVRTALWYRPVISPGPARTHAIEAQTSACHDHGRRAGSVRMLLGIEVGPERLALR